MLRLKLRTRYIAENMYLKRRQIANSVAKGGSVTLMIQIHLDIGK